MCIAASNARNAGQLRLRRAPPDGALAPRTCVHVSWDALVPVLACLHDECSRYVQSSMLASWACRPKTLRPLLALALMLASYILGALALKLTYPLHLTPTPSLTLPGDPSFGPASSWVLADPLTPRCASALALRLFIGIHPLKGRPAQACWLRGRPASNPQHVHACDQK